GLCAVCSACLPRVVDACERCGLARPVASCPRRARDWHVERVIAPFEYAPPLDGYIHALKYRGARRLGRTLALALVEHVRAAARDVDALVPVPLHPLRLRARGFNQAAEIARTLAHALERPVVLARVGRHGAEAPQTGRGAAGRFANVAAAFAATQPFAGARLAIVDDVLTTGATVNALAAALHEAGAARCDVWAVARTPERAD
ncbi:MAG TPA: ComF family protein, partial [Gammaproteobacteria bacterium]|nr:ComF family protein [Gammaproteobacteria bacterium]